MKKVGLIILAALIVGVLMGGSSLWILKKAYEASYTTTDKTESSSTSKSSSSSDNTIDNDTDSNDSTEDSDVESFEPSEAISTLDVDDMFTNNELTFTYDESSATKITLSNDSVTINEEGTYILSGTLSDGQIVIDVEDSEKVYLVLDNVDIACSSSAAIYVMNADKIFIVLAENSSNSLTVSGEYVNTDDENVDAVIYSKSDISFLGTGTLEINAEYGHGIEGKDDVVFISGIYNITSAEHGINANDSIRIKDATFTIDSGKDGMKASNDSDSSKGFIYIANGDFDITAEQDGISSSSLLQIDGGTFSILSGNGFVEVLNEITVGEGSGNTVQATDSLEYSMKSLKACNIIVNDGTLYLSSYEDVFHADYDLIINGGTIEVLSGDDAIHADNTLTINDGDVTVVESYEGIEACYIYINGGNVNVNAYDDAINATESYGCLTVTGGTIYVSSVGDGFDSNGDLCIEGGDITIDCDPIYSGGDGEIDVSGTVTYTGGTIVDGDGNTIDPTSGFSSSGSSGFSQMFPSNNSGSNSSKRK